MIDLAVKSPRKLLSFTSILNEQNLVFRVDAVKLGLFVGGFAGVFELLSCGLRRYRNILVDSSKDNDLPVDNPLDIAIAGTIAGGISINFLPKDTRRTVALYAFARMLQSVFNMGTEKHWWEKIIRYDPDVKENTAGWLRKSCINLMLFLKVPLYTVFMHLPIKF
jgi:hypothetical protein